MTSVVNSASSLPEDAAEPPHDAGRYKWVALTNTTIGVLMATIDASIVLISLPAIFRGIQVDPLTPSNTSYLLWMLMGYMVVTAVLVVSFGRIGDMYGRVKMYNLGFAVFTAGSLAASVTYFGGTGAALYLIAMRIVQGVGGAMIMANSAAILTDAFPRHQRGMALGINAVAGIAGSFIGLVAGGLLAAVDWHLIFYVSVPIGLFGTVWAYRKLREVGTKEGGRLDLPGNLLFGLGLIAVLVGITYALQPYGGADMGWRNPLVLSLLSGGVAMLAAFLVVESRVTDPMFDLSLFRVRAFAAGNIASLLSSIGRGGLMFMLIIWLQGIWLPLHGYDFTATPLWAGIYMLPLTGGFLIAGPASGYLSDRFGARPFATGGMLAAAATFGLLMLLPVNFGYGYFAALLLCNGLAMGLFAAPNTAGIMNAVPANRRGAASGMRSTFQNSGMTLSIGLFFTIMVVGLSSALPAALVHGLTAQGVSGPDAAKVASLPPVSILFAAFLGYNPMQSLLGPTLAKLSPSQQATLTGHSFFSNLIADPFKHGLIIVFTFALIMCLIAALASWLRGPASAPPAARRALPRPRIETRSSMTSNSALLVMDVQQAIVDRFAGSENAAGYLPRLREAIDAAHRAEIPVLHVVVGFRDGHPEISPRNKTFSTLALSGGFAEGAEDARVHPDVAPSPGDILITKKRVSAFAGSDLDLVLRARGVDSLVLTGIATSGVVLSTLRQAADLDFRLTVLSDGCLDADPEVHRVLLEKVFPRQAEIVEVAEWIKSL